MQKSPNRETQQYIAHYSPDNNKPPQSCEEHSRTAAKYAAEALKDVGLENSAYLSTILHDMGKYKEEYQRYLYKSANGESVSKGSVTHTFTGLYYLLNRYSDQDKYGDNSNLCAEILAYAVGAHHGLFDCLNESGESGFEHRIQRITPEDRSAIAEFLHHCATEKELDSLFGKAHGELMKVILRSGELTPPEDESDQAIDKAESENYFIIGMLFRLIASAVMEGDRRDTAEYMGNSIFPDSINEEKWKELLTKTEAKLDLFKSDSPLNKARRLISDSCREAAEKESGIYRLNVPTGGGKTLSSLRYALAHAAKYKKKRVIFTAPLLSILDQNAAVIREYITDDVLPSNIVLSSCTNVVIIMGADQLSERMP